MLVSVLCSYPDMPCKLLPELLLSFCSSWGMCLSSGIEQIELLSCEVGTLCIRSSCLRDLLKQLRNRKVSQNSKVKCVQKMV